MLGATPEHCAVSRNDTAFPDTSAAPSLFHACQDWRSPSFINTSVSGCLIAAPLLVWGHCRMFTASSVSICHLLHYHHSLSFPSVGRLRHHKLTTQQFITQTLLIEVRGFRWKLKVFHLAELSPELKEAVIFSCLVHTNTSTVHSWACRRHLWGSELRPLCGPFVSTAPLTEDERFAAEWEDGVLPAQRLTYTFTFFVTSWLSAFVFSFPDGFSVSYYEHYPMKMELYSFNVL